MRGGTFFANIPWRTAKRRTAEELSLIGRDPVERILVQPHPLVSVGMPAYNAARHIQAAIGSILAQEISDLELIIYDNASTDDTEALCRRAAAENPRVRYFRNERNLGAAENYNLTLRVARGRYFKWSSSNDLCHPEFLRACISALESNEDAVIAYPKTRLFTDDPGVGESYPDHLGLEVDDPCVRFIRFVDGVGLNNIMNGVCRTDALRKVPPIKAYVGSDQVTIAAMTLRGKVVEISAEYFYRRMDPHSATRIAGGEAVHRHYDPSGRKRMVFQLWRLHLEYIRAAISSPLSVHRRARLAGSLLRRMIWGRNRLWRDATASFRQIARRRSFQEPR
jgi:glycosyltransferase involved in cell wall biosynthesis